MKAIGCHVFAGGFTAGVQSVMEVRGQLETHGLGENTVRNELQLPFMLVDDAKGWEQFRDAWDGCELCYGNPRCSSFSSLTGGYDDRTHGPWAKQTRDVHDLCNFAVDRFDWIVWESIQQAFSVGRPLLDHLRDRVFFPAGYKVAHVLLNAATFGNAQRRRRYFFVAYRDKYTFNVIVPDRPTRQTTLANVLDTVCPERTPEPGDFKRRTKLNYHADSYRRLNDDEAFSLPSLLQGENMNSLGRRDPGLYSKNYRDKWDNRASKLPFSLHCLRRLRSDRPASTVYSASGSWVHPTQDRPLTVREIAAIMGWNFLPEGWNPIAQIGKGVVPVVGRWLAKQILMNVSCPDQREWEWLRQGTHTHLRPATTREKVIDLRAEVPDVL